MDLCATVYYDSWWYVVQYVLSPVKSMCSVLIRTYLFRKQRELNRMLLSMDLEDESTQSSTIQTEIRAIDGAVESTRSKSCNQIVRRQEWEIPHYNVFDDFDLWQ